MNLTIDPDRVKRLLSEGFRLRSGIGEGVNGTADVCVMQAVDYIAGGDGRTDHPECADSVITTFAIRVNDSAAFGKWRDELKPYAVRIAGTRVSNESARIRRFMCADWAIRTITPMAFDYWAETVPARRDEALALAAELRTVAPIVNAQTAKVGREVARKARAAAASAADASAAYASAAYASAAYASAAAASAAYASAAYAAARSEAEAFSRKLWDESLAFLDRLISVTEHHIEVGA